MFSESIHLLYPKIEWVVSVCVFVFVPDSVAGVSSNHCFLLYQAQSCIAHSSDCSLIVSSAPHWAAGPSEWVFTPFLGASLMHHLSRGTDTETIVNNDMAGNWLPHFCPSFIFVTITQEMSSWFRHRIGHWPKYSVLIGWDDLTQVQWDGCSQREDKQTTLTLNKIQFARLKIIRRQPFLSMQWCDLRKMNNNWLSQALAAYLLIYLSSLKMSKCTQSQIFWWRLSHSHKYSFASNQQILVKTLHPPIKIYFADEV